MATNEMKTENKTNQWKILFCDVKEKVFSACATPAFLLTFIFVILGVGSIGVWLPPVLDPSLDWVRPNAFLTYSMPILMTIIADIILKDADSKDFNIMCFILCIISASSAIWCIFHPDNRLINILGLSLVLLVLLFKSSNDDKYLQSQSARGAIGGKELSADKLSEGK